ncbi:hypothetical protein HMSSN139_45740 [Paenibacillus sp. HMSSN-139]|nr:hypothetical protein HMSSN139_45740 [Paenibacillus sp. HMSSN-139]
MFTGLMLYVAQKGTLRHKVGVRAAATETVEPDGRALSVAGERL